MQQTTIGLFGFGVVGEGIYHVLRSTPSLGAQIKKICIKHPEKERAAPKELFTTLYTDILGDDSINLVVELIDDATEAFHIVCAAFEKGKSVISANKKMIAEHFPELIALQKKHNVSFLYEAAVCGAIPILRNLEEYYDHDLLQNVSGIVNGSTNYILTQMAGGATYEAALLEAQQKGFAESNPALDVEGWDATNKLTLLVAHAHGLVAHPNNLLRLGINRLTTADAAYAAEKGLRIKLVATAQKLNNGEVAAFVMPQFVTPESQLYAVQAEFNGVVLETRLADKQFLYGKGAGRYPTASAVVSDISAARYQYRYEYKKLHQQSATGIAAEVYLSVYVSFTTWSGINKWDFEEVTETHATAERQYLKGLIRLDKLQGAAWFADPDVSVILMPDGVVPAEAVLQKTLRRASLQLAGLHS